MYQNRFTRILSIVIASQMALSPVAWSQATGAGTAGPQQSGGLENVAAILQGTNTVFTNITQAMQQQAATIAAQNQANALKAEMNPQNCGTVAQPVGCVSEIFPRCQILNTFPNLVEPSECTDGVDGSSPNAAAQAGVAAGYYAHFSLMENEYRLKGLESNNTSNVGMGCLNAHADRLQRQLKAREDEIDNLINKMQKKQDAYKIQAELERNKIEEAMALLEGSNFSSPRSAAILAQNTVRFDNIFKSNQACSAVLDADGFKRDGARGLKGIEASLLTIANRKETTGTSFSGLEFNQSHAERIEKDARRLASFVAREIQNRGTAALEGDFTAGLPSDYGLVGSPTLTTVLIEESKNSQLERDRIMREVQGSVDPNSQGLLTRIDDDTTDFEFELFNWERTQKNECLRRNANISGIISNNLEIIDPNGSERANDNAENSYRTLIVNVLARPDITIEKKIELIKAEERKNGNARYIVDTQTSAYTGGATEESNENVIAPTRNIRPSNFIDRIVQNCSKQFEQNTNSRGVSNRAVVSQLRKTRTKIINHRKQLAGKVQSAVLDRILNCRDSGTANAVGTAVCSSRDFSTASPNFCVKKANACATNMRQCLSAAENEVKKVTTQRDVSVAQYKANTARHEDVLRSMYLETEEITSLDGLEITDNLKANLVLPTNVKFHIDQDKRKYVRGLETLEVQDPDDFFDLMKANLVALKAEVRKQNDQVMRGTPGAPAGAQQGVLGHIANIKSNMENVLRNLASFKNSCQQAYQAYNRGLQQAQQAQQEANNQRQAELARVCNRFNALRQSPVPGCGSVSDLADEIQEIGTFPGGEGVGQLQAYGQLCQRYNSSEEDTVSFATIARQYGGNVQGVCRQFAANPTVSEACTANSAYTARMTVCAAITVPADKITCEDSASRRPDWSAYNTDAKMREVLASALSNNEEFQNSRRAAFQQALQDNGVNELGEISIPACASLDGSGSGAINKALQEFGSQFGAAAVNGFTTPR